MRHDYLEITSTCVWNISKLIITLGFFQIKEIYISCSFDQKRQQESLLLAVIWAHTSMKYS